jgi:hypothetical protein
MVSYLKTPFFHEPLFYRVLSKDKLAYLACPFLIKAICG